MSLRWRWPSNELLCAAKVPAEENDTYIDDRLHYALAVERRVLVPDPDEHETGQWHWAEEING